MNPQFQQHMAEATRLTRLGDMAAATALIQAALGGVALAGTPADATAAARTSLDLFDKSARQPPIPDTRLLHPSRKFDKIINYFYRYRFWIRGTLHL